jgi:hypothetical protein
MGSAWAPRTQGVGCSTREERGCAPVAVEPARVTRWVSGQPVAPPDHSRPALPWARGVRQGTQNLWGASEGKAVDVEVGDTGGVVRT